MTTQLNKLGMRLSAAVISGLAVTSFAGEALANGKNIDDITTKLGAQTNNMPKLIAAVCYVVGAALVGLGIIKLKQHVDQPTQTPLREGISRVVFGALLLVIPFAVQTMLNSMDAQTTSSVKGGGFSFSSGF